MSTCKLYVIWYLGNDDVDMKLLVPCLLELGDTFTVLGRRRLSVKLYITLYLGIDDVDIDMKLLVPCLLELVDTFIVLGRRKFVPHIMYLYYCFHP